MKKEGKAAKAVQILVSGDSLYALMDDGSIFVRSPPPVSSTRGTYWAAVEPPTAATLEKEAAEEAAERREYMSRK